MSKKPVKKNLGQQSRRSTETSLRAWARKRWKPLAGILAAGITASLAGLITTAINSGTSAIERLGNEPYVPFTWVANTDSDSCDRLDRGFVVRSLPARIAATSDGLPVDTNLDSLDAGYSNVTLTVQGKTGTAVVIHGMRISVIKRLPAQGVVVERDRRELCDLDCPTCVGAVDVRQYDANIDRARPVAVPVPGYNKVENKNIPGVPFPFKISSSDPEVFNVRALTSNCDCEWAIRVDWSSGSDSGTATIDNQGTFFRTVGAASLRHYYPSAGSWHFDAHPTTGLPNYSPVTY